MRISTNNNKYIDKTALVFVAKKINMFAVN